MEKVILPAETDDVERSHALAELSISMRFAPPSARFAQLVNVKAARAVNAIVETSFWEFLCTIWFLLFLRSLSLLIEEIENGRDINQPNQ